MAYSTKQKVALINLFKENAERQFELKDIKEELSGLSQATIYRQLDSLIKEEVIKKYLIEGRTFYKYDLENNCNSHYHLICNKCKKIIHLSCHEVKHLSNHIEKDHHFKLDTTKVVFYGLCEDCLKE